MKKRIRRNWSIGQEKEEVLERRRGKGGTGKEERGVGTQVEKRRRRIRIGGEEEDELQ